MNSTVSIIVPVYNVEKYIHQCIDSILVQTHKNIEIILVDDGSPDNCPQICDEFAQKDKRVHVIHQKNAGASAARQAGLEHASGEYIMFVDPDDSVEADMVKEMTDAAEQHKADMVVCNWRTFSKKDREGTIHTHFLNNEDSIERIREAFLMDRQPSFMWNKLYTRELLKNLLFPENIIYEDLYIMAEIISRCHNVFFIPKPFYRHCVHASFSKTAQKVKKKYGSFRAWQEHERVAEKFNLAHIREFSRKKATSDAISLLMLQLENPILTPEQEQKAREYLQEKGERLTVGIPFRFKMEWWALQNAKNIAKIFAKIDLWVDTWQQKRKFAKIE